MGSRHSTRLRGARRSEPGAANEDCSTPRRVMTRRAGLDLTDDCFLALVMRLRRADLEGQADRIVDALTSGQSEVTLTPPDRVAIPTVLDDPPPGLNELCAVLQEHA